jgi:hypothetical protein
MKAYLIIALLALAACGKQNDVPILQEEAATLAKYYQKKLEHLDRRMEEIIKLGHTIPADMPGVKEVGTQLQEARDQMIKMSGMVTPGQNQKSAIETQAEAAGKAGRVDELRRLIHDSELTLDQGLMTVRTQLAAVDTWIHNYKNKTLAMYAPTQPGQPETVSTPATGQPPAAVQQGSAAPAGQGSAAPAPGGLK